MDNYSLVEGFWDPDEFPVDKVDPICLLMNIKPEKILGLAIAEGTKSILRTFEVEKKKFRTFAFNDYDKDLNLEFKSYTVVSIEKSMRTNIFYAAIQSTGNESPRVQQVKIGSDGLLLSSEVVIEIQDFKVISRINGFQVGKTDYLLATGTNTVAVMKASKEKPITIIHVFPGVYSGLVLDICAFKNKFFCAGAESPFITEIATQHNVEDKDIEAQEEILYEKYEVSKIGVQGGIFDKIEMNKKGTSLYLIGKGISAINDIHLAKPQCSKPVNEGSVRFHQGKQYIMVKSLRNGNFIVQESKTYDIVELSPQFKEMKRLKGIPGVVLENESMRSARHSNDEHTLPWIKGYGDVTIITIKDFSMKDIKDFFGTQDEPDLIPILALTSGSGDKLFGVALQQDKVKVCCWEKGSSPKSNPLKDIFSRCRNSE